MADEPSAWKIQKALAIWKNAKNGLVDVDSDDEFLSGDEKISDIDDILARILRSAKKDEQMAAMCAANVQALEARQDRFKQRSERKRRIAVDIMEVLGEKKKEFHDMTVTVSAGRPSVRVIDVTAVPAEYLRVTTNTTVDKSGALSDLKSGVVIPGLELNNAPSVLTIRGI